MKLTDLFGCFRRGPPVAYYTTDGGHLAPHPNMTDFDLYQFECDMEVPDPTFKEPPR